MSVLTVPSRTQVVSDAGPGLPLFIRGFLLDTTLNSKKWGVSESTVDELVYGFVNTPLTFFRNEALTASYGRPLLDHPWFPWLSMEENLKVQWNWAVGKVSEVMPLLDDNGKPQGYDFIGKIDNTQVADSIRRYKTASKSDTLQFYFSPAIVDQSDNPVETGYTDKWIAGHVAFVDQPAYGVHKAILKKKCFGDLGTCAPTLRTAGMFPECPGKMMDDLLAFTNSSLAQNFANDSETLKMGSNTTEQPTATQTPVGNPVKQTNNNNTTSGSTVTFSAPQEFANKLNALGFLTQDNTAAPPPPVNAAPVRISQEEQPKPQEKEPDNIGGTSAEDNNKALAKAKAKYEEAIKELADYKSKFESLSAEKQTVEQRLGSEIAEIKAKMQADQRRGQIEKVIPRDLFMTATGRFNEEQFNKEVESRLNSNLSLDDIAEIYDAKLIKWTRDLQPRPNSPYDTTPMPKTASSVKSEAVTHQAPQIEVNKDGKPLAKTASDTDSSLWFLDMMDQTVNRSESGAGA